MENLQEDIYFRLELGASMREREVQLRRHSIQQDALALCEDVCFTHDDDIFRRAFAHNFLLF
jgi:hypothetical protein